MTVLAHPGRAGTGLTGTGELARLAVRRDRIALPACGLRDHRAGRRHGLHVQEAVPDRGRAGRAGRRPRGANPALRFLYGRLYGTSLGSLTAWRYGVWAGLFAALVAIFVVIRHTRADEEAGRLELVGSAVVGRQAALVAALVTAAAGVLAVSVLLSAALPLVGLPAAGSVALALGIGCCGLAFTGIAAVAAQLTSSARTARGIALAVLGVAFVLRGVGDSAGAAGPSWLSWASPLGLDPARPAVRRFGPLVGTGPPAGRGRGRHRPGLRARRPAGPGRRAAARPAGPRRPPRPPCAARSGWPGGSSGARCSAGRPATRSRSPPAARRPRASAQLLGTSTALEHEFTRLGGQAAITNAYLAALMLLAGLVAAAYAVSVDPAAADRGNRGSWPSRCWPPRPAGSAGRSATSPSPSAAPRCCWPWRGWRPAWATGCGSGPPGAARRPG